MEIKERITHDIMCPSWYNPLSNFLIFKRSRWAEEQTWWNFLQFWSSISQATSSSTTSSASSTASTVTTSTLRRHWEKLVKSESGFDSGSGRSWEKEKIKKEKRKEKERKMKGGFFRSDKSRIDLTKVRWKLSLAQRRKKKEKKRGEGEKLWNLL